MSDKTDLWHIANESSEIFRNNVFSRRYREEIKKILGKSTICSIDGNGFDDKGLISIWLRVACLSSTLDSLIKDFTNTSTDSVNLEKRIDIIEESYINIEQKVAKFIGEKKVLTAKLKPVDLQLLSHLRQHQEYANFAKSIGTDPPTVNARLEKLANYGLVKHIGRRWIVVE
jgi:hypothetical protein